MHTQRTIMQIVVGLVALIVGSLAVLVLTVGVMVGVAVASVTGGVVVALYLLVVRPWHSRWGATNAEVTAAMAGDDLLPDAAMTTRAIDIAARPSDVWPWLVQLGFGRAGWYSYDWIDNDGAPSAETIVDELQHLNVGDRIEMIPGMGFVVRSVVDGETIVSQSDDGSTTWCLRVVPGDDDACRLVSRFRAQFDITAASALWIAISDPGAFVMERRMLKGIKRRAESLARRKEEVT